MPEPPEWRERVIGALGAVVAVALVIGVVAGAVAYGAVRIAGLGGSDDQAASGPAPEPASPSTSAARSAEASPSTPAASPSRTHEPRRKQHKRAEHPHKRRRSGPTLHASPQRVGHMGRVDLTGRYPGHGGTTLVVQRRENGHWQRFPVTATVRGGRFHTWVASGHPGPNRFRVLDPATGAASGPVTVTVR